MITVGPLSFHLYGLLIGLGVLAAALVAAKKTRLVRLKEDDVWNSLLLVVGLGLLGARAYHVIDFWDYYWLNPEEIVMLWKGGLGIFGGILGGGLGLWLFAKSKKKFLKLLDVMALGLPLGQAIGRWGNYVNQELYGKPTNLAWGIFIRPENRPIEMLLEERFHPLFLYESLWSLVVFGILGWAVSKKQIELGKGKLFIFYLGLYGLGRFGLEFLRIDSWRIWGVNVAQAISLGLVAMAGWRLTKE